MANLMGQMGQIGAGLGAAGLQNQRATQQLYGDMAQAQQPQEPPPAPPPQQPPQNLGQGWGSANPFGGMAKQQPPPPAPPPPQQQQGWGPPRGQMQQLGRSFQNWGQAAQPSPQQPPQMNQQAQQQMSQQQGQQRMGGQYLGGMQAAGNMFSDEDTKDEC